MRMKPGNTAIPHFVAAKRSARKVSDDIRAMLRNGGSGERAASLERFFKDDIKSHGWRTANLRKSARRVRKQILSGRELPFLIEVADNLFSGAILEEKIYAVFLLENLTGKFGNEEFSLFESWLSRISSWADHDALVHYLIAPMMAANPVRARLVFRWAKSPHRWHRRAACVALIAGTRKKVFFPEIVRLSNFLLRDEDDMVQKGLGWLLREAAKFDAKRCVPYLKSIARVAPRLVLRTACETLAPGTRKRILAM